MKTNDLLRLAIVNDIMSKLTVEEKLSLLNQLSSDNTTSKDLQVQSWKLDKIYDEVHKGHWLKDFGANIAGNATYSAAMWVLSKLLK